MAERFWDNLLARAFEIPRLAQEEYARATPAMRALYDAYESGVNHYLASNPQVKAKLINRFEPWHTLAMLRARYDAENRAARTMSESIKTQVAAFLTNAA